MKIKHIITAMIFASIISSLLTQSFQLAINQLDDYTKIYWYIYIFAFSPLLFMLFFVPLSKFMEFRDSTRLIGATFIIVFSSLTIYSYYSIEYYAESLWQVIISTYKFIILFVLEENNFNTVIIIIYLLQSIIFISLLLIKVKKSG